MLDTVLDLARRKGAAADALLRDEATLSLKFESGRLKENAFRQEKGLNLRVTAHGRVGVAGTTDLTGVDDVVERAFASAAEGDMLDLAFPGRAPVAAVETWSDRAAGLSVDELAWFGRRVVERLARPGWQVNASIDRYVETTRFANSAGQSCEYRATAISVSADVTRVAGDDVLMAYDYSAAVAAPAEADLDRIARTIVTKMERAERVVEPPEGRLPVLFTPEGSAAILLPLRQALSGKTVLQGVSPVGGKVGERLFDEVLTLTDDPLTPGRIASRPLDDEGTASARLPLIERGVVRAFVYDLETAARTGTRSTGHGKRATFGKPGIAFSNLVLESGALDEDGLLEEIGHGLVVDELIGVGQGNTIAGGFSHPVALAYRVDGGAIAGRVKDAAVAGNVYELLKRIRALGRDAKWIAGTRRVPPMVLDGVNVARR